MGSALVGSFRLLAACDVEVVRRTESGADRFGAPTYETETEQVSGVLPQPGGTSDVGAERPEGVRVDMTFHFPKGYGKSLKGCEVVYGGRSYRVVGDPQPYVEENTPGPWDLTVETEAVDG